MKKDDIFWNNYFKHTSQRIEGLVEAFTYGDELARLAHIYTDLWALFKRNPRHAYVAVFAPYNAAILRLNQPEYEEQAIATMRSHQKETFGPLHLLLILFLRIIWFDWFLDMLGTMKYHIQVSRWWPHVREWRVTRAANWVWTLPKRALFDQTS